MSLVGESRELIKREAVFRVWDFRGRNSFSLGAIPGFRESGDVSYLGEEGGEVSMLRRDSLVGINYSG